MSYVCTAADDWKQHRPAGRFSNGPTWIEVAAAMLGQPLTNLATGNAASGAVPGAFTVEPYFGEVQV